MRVREDDRNTGLKGEERRMKKGRGKNKRRDYIKNRHLIGKKGRIEENSGRGR